MTTARLAVIATSILITKMGKGHVHPVRGILMPHVQKSQCPVCMLSRFFMAMQAIILSLNELIYYSGCLCHRVQATFRCPKVPQPPFCQTKVCPHCSTSAEVKILYWNTLHTPPPCNCAQTLVDSQNMNIDSGLYDDI